jgi:hypothetical protein
MKLWHIDERLGRELGISGIFADVPSFQIVNDVASGLRWINGSMVSLMYGPHAEHVKAHKDWAKAEELWMNFQPRFVSLDADAVKAVALYEEVNVFIERYLLPIEASLKDIAA